VVLNLEVPPLPTGYNNTYEIFQTPGSVVILDENIHDVRVVPLDGRPHLNPNIRQWNGDSRGHWENNTLVVETTNYSPRTTFRFPVITTEMGKPISLFGVLRATEKGRGLSLSPQPTNSTCRSGGALPETSPFPAIMMETE